jgi:hypothetical protein
MLEDNLTKAKLGTMIGAARFNTPTDFKDFLKDKLRENFQIEDNRVGEKPAKEVGREDILIFDEMTRREAIVVIGLKVASTTPQFTEDDLARFHERCKAEKAYYGVLITETEARFFQYKKAGDESFVEEIEELEPLNYVDYEAEKVINKQKIQDYLIRHKKWVIGAGFFVALMIAVGLAQATACRTTGIVLGDVTKDGEKFYYLPGDSGYEKIVIGDLPGERRFCAEQDAINKGWIRKVQ